MARPASYDTDLYLAHHRGTPGDVTFYRRECREVRTLLELGCGDGRMLAALKPETRERVVGVDLDPKMLERAKTRLAGVRTVRLYRADMARFTSRRRFERILIPFAGLFCLSPEKKRECLRRVRRQLTSSGRLLCDVYATDELDAEAADLLHRDVRPAEPLEDDYEWVARLRSGSRWYEVYEKNDWWPSRKRLDVCYRYVPVEEADARRGAKAGSPREGTIRHWYASREQLRQLFQAHGFEAAFRRLRRDSAGQQWAIVARVSRR